MKEYNREEVIPTADLRPDRKSTEEKEDNTQHRGEREAGGLDLVARPVLSDSLATRTRAPPNLENYTE